MGDNAFTNVMARWNIERALETIDLLCTSWPDRGKALWTKLALTEEERLGSQNLSPAFAYPDTYGDTPGHNEEATEQLPGSFPGASS